MKRNAFSLVELSIVLVILGLLVGGILAGQSLIRAGELRSVIGEHDRYKTAVAAFRDKYFAYPGDMANAVKFWGAQAGGTADGQDSTCAALTTAATSVATCNGNGDGRIGFNADGYEVFRAWQHLANAGLIEGQFSGIPGSAGTAHAIIGTNDPASKLGSGAGWGMFHLRAGTMPQYNSSYQGAVLALGGNTVAENDFPNNTIMTATEAWNLDTKMDDGAPIAGQVRSMVYASRPNCINSTETAYQLSYSGLTCNLTFVIAP